MGKGEKCWKSSCIKQQIHYQRQLLSFKLKELAWQEEPFENIMGKGEKCWKSSNIKQQIHYQRQLLSFELKEFVYDNFKFDENGGKLSERIENTVGKKKLLTTSNFFFSHSVFKRLVLQTCKNQGLFRKGLKENKISDCSKLKDFTDQPFTDNTFILA